MCAGETHNLAETHICVQNALLCVNDTEKSGEPCRNVPSIENKQFFLANPPETCIDFTKGIRCSANRIATPLHTANAGCSPAFIQGLPVSYKDPWLRGFSIFSLMIKTSKKGQKPRLSKMHRKSRRQPVKPKNSAQTSDLRTPPYSKARAIHSSYEACLVAGQTTCGSQHYRTDGAVGASSMASDCLPPKTQARFLDAASVGFENGYPLNAILTVNWTKLTGELSEYWLDMHPHERAKQVAQKIRKFLTRAKRNCTTAYIWVREALAEKGEHLHVALHVPVETQRDFVCFLGRALGETSSKTRRPLHKRSKGEIACSPSDSWHFGVEVCDGSPEFSGYWLAAYLAKAEPSQRMFRGRLVNNELKKERGRAFGGRIRGEKYDVSQGFIEGNKHRNGRFFISKSLRR